MSHKITVKRFIHKVAYASLGAGVLALLISLPNTAQAQSERFFDYAKVQSVAPIYKTYRHRIPQETCWTETVRREYEAPRQYQSATSTIVGGIIGGAIGHAVGHGKSNKRVGTVVGSVLGMSIANDARQRNQRNRHHDERHVSYDDIERCDVSYRTEAEEKLIGYDVSYSYRGETYHTHMDKHPGKRIKVSVSVQPVSDY